MSAGRGTFWKVPKQCAEIAGHRARRDAKELHEHLPTSRALAPGEEWNLALGLRAFGHPRWSG